MSGPHRPRISAIVLAGGRAARLGGLSKPDLLVNGAPLLQTAVAAAQAVRAQRTVVVGPAHLAAAGAAVVTEDPPFGGPVAGLAAGLGELDRLGDDADWILVLPVDLPQAGAAAALLAAALAVALAEAPTDPAADPIDGLHLSDAEGRAQWLTAVYRRTALLGAGAAGSGPSRGRSMRELVGALRLAAVDDAAGTGADIDTWADLERHRGTAPAQKSTGGDMTDPKPRDTPDLSEWIAALADELGIDAALIDVPALLAVAGDVAHNVARPAAPVTTFAVALAALRDGGDADALRRAVARVSALARAWPGRSAD